MHLLICQVISEENEAMRLLVELSCVDIASIGAQAVYTTADTQHPQQQNDKHQQCEFV